MQYSNYRKVSADAPQTAGQNNGDKIDPTTPPKKLSEENAAEEGDSDEKRSFMGKLYFSILERIKILNSSISLPPWFWRFLGFLIWGLLLVYMLIEIWYSNIIQDISSRAILLRDRFLGFD